MGFTSWYKMKYDHRKSSFAGDEGIATFYPAIFLIDAALVKGGSPG